MEILKLVKPVLAYENEAIEYIGEFYQYGSPINGVGGLHRKQYLENYTAWLEKLREDRIYPITEEKVPTETYFLVRESDDRIVGMTNIRLALNEKLKKCGGHIGYSIRPTERRKGYNKINLYLSLLECQKHGIKEALIDCDQDNLGSAKTIQALGGKLVQEYYDDENDHCILEKYIIDVDVSVKKNQKIYEKYIIK